MCHKPTSPGLQVIMGEPAALGTCMLSSCYLLPKQCVERLCWNELSVWALLLLTRKIRG